MQSHDSSRRRFLRQVVLGGGAVAGLPYIIPRRVLGASGTPGANERINVALIGMGRAAGQLRQTCLRRAALLPSADVDLSAAKAATRELQGQWNIYQDYRHILEKEPVNGVVLCMCDHNRIRPAIHALQAAKDIYVEKPFSLYVAEGRALVQAVQHYNRVCQAGMQSRTIGANRTVLGMVREGKLGKLQSIACRNYAAVGPCPSGSAQPIPAQLDWDKWCGQTELAPYSDNRRLHWFNYNNYCGGKVTFLGAHAYDMIQCALGTDETGPVEIWTTSPAGPDAKVRIKYANGFEVSLEAADKASPVIGAVFTCEKGRIAFDRNLLRSTPKGLGKGLPPAEMDEVGGRPGWMGKSHLANWLDCIKTRNCPNAYAEIGHRTASLCHLVNIVKQLGRRLHWDPAAEQFLGDNQANALLGRPRRKGYELPALT